MKKAIAMICDDSYVVPCVTAITSLSLNCSAPQNYVIYIFTHSISDENRLVLETMCKVLWTLDIRIGELDLRKYESIYVHYDGSVGAGSITALAKFDLPALLKEDVVLYLDGDIIIQQDISEIFERDLGNKMAAVVKDSGKIYNRGGLREELPKYFNSGVMLLNLKQMREENATQKLVEAKRALNNHKLVDQDAFNIVFRGRVILLPIQYNALLVNLHNACSSFSMRALNDFYGTSFSSIYDLEDSVSILHFASKEKPWKYSDVRYSDLWMEYYRKSPCFDNTLQRGLFHSNPLENNNVPRSIPVLLATDLNHLPQTYVTILSVLKNLNTLCREAIFYIAMPKMPSQEARENFDLLSDAYPQAQIVFVEMGENSYSYARLSIKHITSPTFYRLNAASLFPQHSKIVYLDSDVIVEGDLSEFFSIELGRNYVAGVKAASYHSARDNNREYCLRNGLPAIDSYINAGVLLMNLDQIRADNLEAQFISRSKCGYRGQDQDVINGACYGRILHLPYKYNCQITKYEKNPEQTSKVFSAEVIREGENRPVIIHYAAPIKPWCDFTCALSDRWWKYAMMSPYKSFFLNNDSFLSLRIKSGIRHRFILLSEMNEKRMQQSTTAEQIIRRLYDENRKLKQSEAYRVGMFATWPIRKVWGGIKCLRENGFKYTAKHFVGKVARTLGLRSVKW